MQRSSPGSRRRRADRYSFRLFSDGGSDPALVSCPGSRRSALAASRELSSSTTAWLSCPDSNPILQSARRMSGRLPGQVSPNTRRQRGSRQSRTAGGPHLAHTHPNHILVDDLTLWQPRRAPLLGAHDHVEAAARPARAGLAAAN